MKIALTGGGTGGHLFPALAVGEELKNRGHEVFYVGSAGLESRVAPQHFPFYQVTAGKLDRTAFRPGEALKLVRGLAEALALARRTRPDVVFATGGYVSFPFALATSLLGSTLVLHEQNAKLGLANRLLANRARLLTLAVPADVPRGLKARTRLVGMPVRERRYPQGEARARLGLEPDLPTLLVLGGSQGARVFNERLPALLAPFLDRLQVLHQTGHRWLDETRKRINHPRYHLTDFLDTALAWSATDLAITRAGAMTLAEAAYHQVPLILVPLPTSAGGHQRKNAQLYEAQGAARVVEQTRMEDVQKHLEAMLAPKLRVQMQRALEALSPAGSAEKIALLIETSAKGAPV